MSGCPASAAHKLTEPRPEAVPVLTFSAEPDGGPPPVLRANAIGEFARRPAGGPPMRVLRRRADVLRTLTDSRHFAMAGVTESGELRGCPLTGAEMQSPDGGLLNMDPPRLRDYRQRINRLFTRGAAEATRPAVHALATGLAAGLASKPAADVLSGFAEPFTAAAVCQAMGIPSQDWDEVLEYSRIAFAVVPSSAEVAAVEAAWTDLYDYYEQMVAAKRAQPDDGLISQLITALDGFTTSQVVHVIGTVSNGFGAVLPVLAVALTELAQRPNVVASCRSGEWTWDLVAAWLLTRRAMFPVALPRVALADSWLDGQLVPAGSVLLPSLIAASYDPSGPPSRSIPFGAGPHFCPGAALTRVWLSTALAVFFAAYPAARLAGPLDWQPGTLSVPREIILSLR
jgi:cytochrome P450